MSGQGDRSKDTEGVFVRHCSLLLLLLLFFYADSLWQDKGDRPRDSEGEFRGIVGFFFFLHNDFKRTTCHDSRNRQDAALWRVSLYKQFFFLNIATA